jgi:hypothetical protein
MEPADMAGNKRKERLDDDTVRLTDIATRLPGLLIDAPVTCAAC